MADSELYDAVREFVLYLVKDKRSSTPPEGISRLLNIKSDCRCE